MVYRNMREKNSEATAGFTKLFESFGLEGLTALPSYPQTYGGAYIDDKGDLVVQYTADDQAVYSSKAELRRITGLQSVNTEQVDFSYNELVTANNAIGEYIVHVNESLDTKPIPADSPFEGEIVETAIDPRNNAVVVWLEDASAANIDAFRETIFDAPYLRFMPAPEGELRLE